MLNFKIVYKQWKCTKFLKMYAKQWKLDVKQSFLTFSRHVLESEEVEVKIHKFRIFFAQFQFQTETQTILQLFWVVNSCCVVNRLKDLIHTVLLFFWNNFWFLTFLITNFLASFKSHIQNETYLKKKSYITQNINHF